MGDMHHELVASKSSVGGGFKKLLTKLANEPVVVIGGFISSALVWASAYGFTNFDPSKHEQQISAVATGIAFLLSLVLRQFVTPAAKVAAKDAATVIPAPVVITVPAPTAVDAAPVESDTDDAPVEVEPDPSSLEFVGTASDDAPVNSTTG